MTQVAYDLAAFTRDLDAIVDEHAQDDAALVRRVKPLLERLLADPAALAERYAVPAAQGSVQYLLHRHPGDAYTVVAVVFPEDYSTPVHDHTTWGLVGVWRGEEREERFVRVDDGARPEHATLRPAGMVFNTPGMVTWLVPPDQEIHRIKNVAPHPSVSIHVYGGNLNGKLRHRFDLDSGEVKEFRTTVVTLD